MYAVDLDRVLAAARAGPLAESPIHGERHWSAVAALGLDLCAEVPLAEPLVVLLFAILHDCRRTHEQDDPGHGTRAAGLVAELAGEAIGLSRQRLGLLLSACRLHTSATRIHQPTLAVCFDADRLNLWRLGIEPSSGRLSTHTAQQARWRHAGRLYAASDWSDSWPQLGAYAWLLANQRLGRLAPPNRP